MKIILSLLESILETLKANSYLYVVLGVCLVAILTLSIILIIINSGKDSETEEMSETKLIRQTLKEESSPELVLNKQKEIEEVQEEPRTEYIAEIETIEEENPVVEEEVQAEPIEDGKEDVKVEETEPTKKTRIVNGKYEVYFDGTSYYYALKASNGELLIKSEAYATKDSVYLAIDAIKRNVVLGKISVRQDKHGLYQFVLTAKNHRTLVMSANYTTEKRAESASMSFKRFAVTSPIIEIEETVVSDKEEIIVENITNKKGGKLGVLPSENGYYYVLKASNGEVLVHSNFYKTELSALNAMEKFKASVFTGKFFVEKDKRNNYQFKLFNTNGRIVCVGHIYATKALAVASVNSVCSFVKLATPIEE